MRNILIILLLLLLPLALIATAKDASEEVSFLLTRADALKHAEKYEEAERLYLEALRLDPDNLAAQKGRQDCQIMLEPAIPMQHLLPPMHDEGYKELIKEMEKAETPWDKRRAEIAIECYGVEYTGKVFAKEAKDLAAKADEMIEQAVQRAKKAGAEESTYMETAEKLKSLQAEADCGWKGHGPAILETSLEKLDKLYKAAGYSNPTKPLAIAAQTSPEVTAEGQAVELLLSVTNRSSTPVILIDLWLAGLEHKTFSWQKAMFGSLEYNNERDIFYYNQLAQQETYGIFNLGLLFPGQTTGFRKKVRVPSPSAEAHVRFAVLDEETVKYVYIEKKDASYEPASLVELKSLARDRSLITEEPRFPDKATVIFDDFQARVWTQSSTLDLGPK
ncbi:tetratricopeptide repeat protein [Candidatus Margulisiibacteriota bacterium]